MTMAGWSDEDDLSLGSSMSEVDIGRIATTHPGDATATATNTNNNNNNNNNHGVEEEDYIPDSLRDFIAEADAALAECLCGGSSVNTIDSATIDIGAIDFGIGVTSVGVGIGIGITSSDPPSTKKGVTVIAPDDHEHEHGEEHGREQFYNQMDTSTDNTNNSNSNSNSNSNGHQFQFKLPTLNPDQQQAEQHPNQQQHQHQHQHNTYLTQNTTPTRNLNPNNNPNNQSFHSPPSDLRGAYDTDMGSLCRPNPANLYSTHSAVKRIALNDDPDICPDHGDSCTCHLKQSLLHSPVLKLDELLSDGSVSVSVGMSVGMSLTGSRSNSLTDEDGFMATPNVVHYEPTEQWPSTIGIDKSKYYTPAQQLGEHENELNTNNIINTTNQHQNENHNTIMNSSVMNNNSVNKNINNLNHNFINSPMVVGNFQLMMNTPDAIISDPLLCQSVEKQQQQSQQQHQHQQQSQREQDDDQDMEVEMDMDINAFLPNSEIKALPPLPPSPLLPSTNMNININTSIDLEESDDDDDDDDDASFLPNSNHSISSSRKSISSYTNINTNSNSITGSSSNDQMELLHCDTFKKSNVTIPKIPTPRQSILNSRVRPSSSTRGTATTTAARSTTKTSTSSKRRSLLVNKNRQQQQPPPRPSSTKSSTSTNRNKNAMIKGRNSLPSSLSSSTKTKTKTTTSSTKTTLTKPRNRSHTRNRNRRTSTIPKSPALHTKRLRGARRYSGVGLSSAGMSSSMNDNDNGNTHNPNSNPAITTATTTTTTTTNISQTKTRGKENKKMRTSTNTPTNNTNRTNKNTPVVPLMMTTTATKRSITIAKGPKLKTQELHGERHYSGVGHSLSTTIGHGHGHGHGIGEEKKEIETDYKNKALTVPIAPKLISSEKLGNRIYSAVGIREEKVERMEDSMKDDHSNSTIDYKTKALTVPQAPKLISGEKLGDRRYSVIGIREEKVEEVDTIQLDWTDRKVTVPKAPTLSTSLRPQRDKKNDDIDTIALLNEKRAFKAMPIMSGVLTRRIVTARRVPRKAPTVPKPFHLEMDERIPDTKKLDNAMLKKAEKSPTPTVFRARPVPDFSRPPSSSLQRVPKKPLTSIQPFNLKTSEPLSSPRAVRISKASESIRKTISSSTKQRSKKVVTTPKPFNFATPTLPPKMATPSTKIELAKSTKPPTTPKPFHLSSPNKRSPKPNVSNDLLQFMSPTKKRKVTVVKPFRLSSSRPSKPPPPPTTNEIKPASTKIKKKVIRPPAPPRVKRNATKLKPFSLSRTNAKIKSQTNQEIHNDFKARPLPVNNTTRNDVKIDKDECPINFRRKLLLRSTRSNTGSADRDEKNKKVLSQLEELSALVQQTVI